MRTFSEIDREAHERVRTLDREVALFAVGHLIGQVNARFHEAPAVGRWLQQVREDVIDTWADSSAARPRRAPGVAGARHTGRRQPGRAVLASLPRQLVRHARRWAGRADPGRDQSQLPEPVRTNRVREPVRRSGADHGHLCAGAVHRADGGYLVLRTLEALSRPLVWSKLKDVLRTARAQLENPAEQLMLAPTASLTPEAIDLDLKVVLIGTPEIHRLLYALDEDVRDLFRVRAEFDVEVPWSDELRAWASRSIGQATGHARL